MCVLCLPCCSHHIVSPKRCQLSIPLFFLTLEEERRHRVTGEQLHRPCPAACNKEGAAFPIDLGLGKKYEDSVPTKNPMIGLQDPLDSTYRALVSTCFPKAIRGLSGLPLYRTWLSQVRVIKTWSSTLLFLDRPTSHRKGKSFQT